MFVHNASGVINPLFSLEFSPMKVCDSLISSFPTGFLLDPDKLITLRWSQSFSVHSSTPLGINIIFATFKNKGSNFILRSAELSSSTIFLLVHNKKCEQRKYD